MDQERGVLYKQAETSRKEVQKMTRAEKIGEIIKIRQKTAAMIDGCHKWIRQAQGVLSEFKDKVLSDFEEQDKIPTKNGRLPFSDQASMLIEDMSIADSAFVKLSNHFAKKTIAIAVVGIARNGKSTFLQSLTGLDNDQIPAQDGNACTSTQSLIVNDNGGRWAKAYYYTREEFLQVITNCYRLMRWGEPSVNTISGFLEDFGKRSAPEEMALRNVWEQLKLYLGHIRELDANVFMPRLDSESLDMAKVKETVTYDDGATRHQNIAVSRVEIHCPFPADDVGAVSVVDTPGLNAASQERDKMILTDVLNRTADFVLFVHIPEPLPVPATVSQMFDLCKSCFNQHSGSTLKDRAFFVANQAIVRDKKTGAITRDGTTQRYNDNLQKAFEKGDIPAERIIRADVSKPEEVRKKVLDPIIDYLTKEFPILDGKEVQIAEDDVKRLRSRLERLVADAHAAFGLDRTIDHDGFRRLIEQFDAFFPHFSGQLTRIVDEKAHAENQITDSDEPIDNPFVNKVSEVFQSYRDEIGQTLSLKTVQFEMDRLPGQGGAAFYNLLSHLRCRVRDCFSKVEDACYGMVENAKSEVSSVFVAPLPYGGGLGGVAALKDADGKTLSGSEFFRVLAELCKEAAGKTGCRSLAAQFKKFAAFELKFSGFLEHRVSVALTPLRQGSCASVLGGQPDFSSAESIRAALLKLGDEAVNRVACALVEKSASEPNQAIFAILENFVDRTLRTQGMEKEWREFYEIVRAEVWPEVFDPHSTTNVRISVLRELVEALFQLARALPINQPKP